MVGVQASDATDSERWEQVVVDLLSHFERDREEVSSALLGRCDQRRRLRCKADETARKLAPPYGGD